MALRENVPVFCVLPYHTSTALHWPLSSARIAGIRWAMKLDPPSIVLSMNCGRRPKYSATGSAHMQAVDVAQGDPCAGHSRERGLAQDLQGAEAVRLADTGMAHAHDGGLAAQLP